MNVLSRIEATRQQINNGICDEQTQVCWFHQGIQRCFIVFIIPIY